MIADYIAITAAFGGAVVGSCVSGILSIALFACQRDRQGRDEFIRFIVQKEAQFRTSEPDVFFQSTLPEFASAVHTCQIYTWSKRRRDGLADALQKHKTINPEDLKDGAFVEFDKAVDKASGIKREVRKPNVILFSILNEFKREASKFYWS